MTGNLPLLSFMSHQSHHCHAPIHMHICTHTHTLKTHAPTHSHTCTLQARSCHEVTARTITTIRRGYMCFPRGCIWMEFKTVLLVDKQTKKINEKIHHFKKEYRIRSLCLLALVRGQFLSPFIRIQGSGTDRFVLELSLSFINH